MAESAGAQQAVDPLRIWFRFIRLQRRTSAAIGGELKALGLSIPQQELAQRLYVTKGNVSGLVDRLVEAGLVERLALPGDRRSHALHLTPHGRELARRGLEAQRDYVARTLGRLGGADLAALDRLVGLWRDEARRDEAGRGPVED
jgi:DNA-binding MarR family transcriptional regulator